ncbi:ParA family protein [Haladaptatus sp. F3-133]|jgi:chromosome partitioning protein|uniref:ParA family protein n=1 Tax=Halorutilus salinus TaxID=2487751 RepID=A0A9Q4C1P6_9EURY|nr:ParA family protein [Halorutilus salinus]MCX2818307.1 ParA family protein [Halorutilus salinus]
MRRPSRVATFIDKGGTGKTTVAAHLGVALAEAGEDVLLVDLAGKQGDLSKHFGLWDDVEESIESDDDWPNISTVFQDEWDIIVEKLGEDAVDDLIHGTDEDIDVIPAHPGLDSLDAELGNIDSPSDRYSRLDDFLTEYVDPLGYDVVLVDLPGITNNVTYNGLWAARNAVVPVEAGVFEASQLEALEQDLEKMDDSFGVTVDLSMVVPNKIDRRTKLSKEYLKEFRDAYPDVLGRPIPVSQEIRNAANDGHTVFDVDEPSKTGERACRRFAENAEELRVRISDDEPVRRTEAVSDD